MPDYTPEFEARVKKWSRAQQEKKRYKHTKRVVKTADELAARWAPDEAVVCRLAGWIHDAAKEWDDAELLRYAENAGVPISAAERENPMLLHGVVAYLLADAEFGLHDGRLRTACAYHTSGSPQMSLTDKIVFLADLIEPKRDFPSVAALRERAFEDLDSALLMAVQGTVRYLLDERQHIDPRVIELHNVLLRAGVT
ncbi:MAG: bis(5'-nucleosyl)-tetraphosphatase (symmetrical) YqeK [Anaerolineales bacterium]